MRRRSAVWLIGAVVVVLATVAVVWWTSGPTTTRIPISGVVAGEHTIEVSLTYSSCTEFDRIDAVEDSRSVRLRAFVHDVPWCGTAPTTTKVVQVRLEHPLQGRQVLDGDLPVRAG